MDEAIGDEALVAEVKEHQRRSEAARSAWRSYCDSEGGGVRDPKRHCTEFLRSFLAAYSDGSICATESRAGAAGGDAQLVEVSTREFALGDRQLTLKMPQSEEGILKEVVTTNVYGFLPGRTCNLRGGDVLLDIGAHVGIAASLALRTEGVRVVCAEPHPVTFDILKHNLAAHVEAGTAELLNVGVADVAGARELFPHTGTAAPSRLYFSSLFSTRPHADETISVECMAMQDLVLAHRPTVIKIDAEGAERFLLGVDFPGVRLLVVEWDWTHNRNRRDWVATEQHLVAQGFRIDVRGRMPDFDEAGVAKLHAPNGKKRGNTGMIFHATRAPAADGCAAAGGAEPATAPAQPTERPCASSLVEDGAAGCPVAALLCEAPTIGRVFEACRPHALLQPKGAVRLGDGRMAVHLNLEGAAQLCCGEAPPEVRELLAAGAAELAPGLRRGAASQAYRGPGAAAAPAAAAERQAAFRFIDLFAGIGGFRRGLEAVGGRCVFSSEIDRDCQETYALNFGGDHLFGDLIAIETSEIPEHDILTAGFPCQPFTRRGGRAGFSDGRGGLFLEIPRILHARRPAGFLLENVWNLLYLEGGRWDKDESKCVFGEAWKRVVACLEGAGYVVRAKVLNARGWVPQDRERVYIVGFRNDLAAAAERRFRWPEPPSGGGGALRDVLEPAGSDDAAACELTECQWDAVRRSSSWGSGGARLRFVDPDGAATTLTSSYKGSFANLAQLVGPAESGLERPRFFTRRECARLMGFGEGHLVGNPNCPNRAYHQLGNAVCPPLIGAIARRLARSLDLVPSDGGEEDAMAAPADYGTTTGGQPPLREQLEALTVEQLSSRLESWGVRLREPSAAEFVRGFRASRKGELLDAACEAYAARAAERPRQVVHDAGVPIPEAVAAEVLAALRMMDWRENVRPAVRAAGYCVLKPPHEPSAPPRWRPSDPRAVRRRLWELGAALLREASPRSAAFGFTAIAVSKNLRGSPHIDKNDLSVQYALSLGDFEEGGGRLCIEESPFVVRALDTRGRLACIDGRFPHWVSGYVGERYSVIFYRSSGVEDPPIRAVQEV